MEEKTKVVGKFYGNRKVVDVSESTEKTYSGNEKVLVTFEGGEVESLPLKIFLYVLTDTPVTDLKVTMKKRIELVLNEAISSVADSELTRDEQFMLTNEMNLVFDTIIDKAIKAMFNKDVYNTNLAEIDAFIKAKNS